MSSYEVVVAGYPPHGTAQQDFDELVRRITTKEIRSEGAILVEKQADGEVVVTQTGDHLGRKGMGWGAGVGVLVGLAAPRCSPRSPSAAQRGQWSASSPSAELKSGLEEGSATNLQPGMAAVITIIDTDDRLVAEQALPGSPAKSVAPTEGTGIDELKEGLAEAMGKFKPDRTVLPIPDRTFGGSAAAPWTSRSPTGRSSPGTKPPEGAPNVLIVLIDDAGFGGPDTFGGAIRTPNLTRVQQMGLTYNRFHVTARVLADPCGAADRAEPAPGRHGLGSPSSRARSPATPGARPKLMHRRLPRILKENGYMTGGFGKWHMTPGREQGPRAPSTTGRTGWGFDHWWGFLTGAAGQYDPIITQDNSTLGVPEGEDGKLYYFPDDITDKAVEWLHAVRGAGRREAVVHLLLDRLRPRPAPRGQGVGRQVQGQVRRRLGRATGRGRSSGRSSSASSRRTPS